MAVFSDSHCVMPTSVGAMSTCDVTARIAAAGIGGMRDDQRHVVLLAIGRRAPSSAAGARRRDRRSAVMTTIVLESRPGLEPSSNATTLLRRRHRGSSGSNCGRIFQRHPRSECAPSACRATAGIRHARPGGPVSSGCGYVPKLRMPIASRTAGPVAPARCGRACCAL